MRIRRNSEFASLRYLKDNSCDDICILNQNPRDIILDPFFQSESQTDVKTDDFCGLASFGSTVKDLLSEMYPTEEGKDKTENEPVVYCSFTDASGFNCGMEARAGSQYCEVHVQLPKNRSTCSESSKRGAKKGNRQLIKRKKPEDSSPGDEMLYYAGFPGLRRKRGPISEVEALNINVDESG